MKNNKKISYVVMSITLSTSLLFMEQASAAIFKCTSANGTIFYNDKPCPKKDAETEMRAVKDPLNVRKISKGTGVKEKPFVDKSKKAKDKKSSVAALVSTASESSGKKKTNSSSNNNSTVLKEDNKRTKDEMVVSDALEKEYSEQRFNQYKITESVVAGSDELERLMKSNDNHTKNELARSSPR